MRALWKHKIIAEAPKNDLIFIEGNWYFPPNKVKSAFLRKSSTPYHCPWKGDCQYFNVGEDNDWSKDAAWSYPKPKQSALEIVGKDFSNFIAFWHEVTVEESKDA